MVTHSHHPRDARLQPLRSSRRDFVLGSLLGGAALASGLGCAGPSRSSGTADASSAATAANGGRKLGVALLGLGSYAQGELAPALKKTRHCALRGIVTGTPSKIPGWQREHAIADGNVYDYQSLPRIANDPAIDVVYVVTPTALHLKYAVMAAEAGKHVWCEKPMAMTATDCQTMIDACRRNKVSLSIGYRMQHEPNTQTVMRWAKEKPYGALTGVRAVAGDKSGGDPTWRMVRSMGGGALYDMGVYAVNGIRYASGEEPLRVVRARQWADRPDLFTDVDENTEFELELPSGVVAYGKASRANSENALRVTAAQGSYFLEPMQSYTGVQGQASDGQKLDQKIDSQQARQMDDEALAILEGRPAQCPGEEGQRDIRIIEAILDAARTGNPVALT